MIYCRPLLMCNVNKTAPTAISIVVEVPSYKRWHSIWQIPRDLYGSYIINALVCVCKLSRYLFLLGVFHNRSIVIYIQPICFSIPIIHDVSQYLLVMVYQIMTKNSVTLVGLMSSTMLSLKNNRITYLLAFVSIQQQQVSKIDRIRHFMYMCLLFTLLS